MNDELDSWQHTRPARRPGIVAALATVLAVLVVWLGVVQCRGWDGSTNADGVSYLDLASRYAVGDWRAMANGYRSPLYPILLGGARRLAASLPGRPAPELAVVFTVNVVIFALVALAFARLARLLIAPVTDGASRAVLGCRLVAAGSLCIWSLIRFIGATTITPDGLLAALLFLVSADLVDAARTAPNRGRDLRFGVSLALGYWTKAVFFPVAIVSIAAYALASGRETMRQVVPRVVLTMIVIAAPLIGMQSWSQGRPSFGETGRLNYRWYVGGAEHAAPLVEPAVLTRARTIPAVVALTTARGAVLFTGSVPGSFPYWFDPSRFEPAGTGALSAAAQWRALRFNSHWLSATAGLPFALALIAMIAAAARGRVRWSRLWATVPALSTLALYLLTHPEGRMGAASLASVLLTLLVLFDVGIAERRRAALIAECVALVLLSAVAIGRTTNRIPSAPTTALADDAVLPRHIQDAGVREGDAIGVVGEPYGLRWAHEIAAHIVVTMPASHDGTVITDSTLAAVAAESAKRGAPLAAILYPASAGVGSSTSIPVGANWFVWPAASKAK